MRDTNSVTLVGRLTRDAETSYTQGGTSILKFSIAVNRGKKVGDGWEDEVSFFDITFFGKSGDAISNYMQKGKQVAVSGELVQDRWTNQEGEKRSKVYVMARNVQLLGGREQEKTTTQKVKDTFSDDIPF